MDINKINNLTVGSLDCNIQSIGTKNIVNANCVIYAGKIRTRLTRDEHYLVINTNTGNCAIVEEGNWHGPYEFKNVTIEIKENSEIIYQTNGYAPVIIGGILFGSGGALAGSLVSSKTQKRQTEFVISIKVNDLKYSGLICCSKNIQFAHYFGTKIETVRKMLVDKSENTSKDGNNFNDKNSNLSSMTIEELSNVLLQLKTLYENGIIEKEIYEQKKNIYYVELMQRLG
jgi:hypothetical protein